MKTQNNKNHWIYHLNFKTWKKCKQSSKIFREKVTLKGVSGRVHLIVCLK